MGQVGTKATTHEVISRLDPFYASIDQVRLAGGMLIRKLSDLTLACTIYNTSQKADLLCLHPPTDPQTDQFKRLVGSRNNWVALSSARELLMNVNQLIGPGLFVLWRSKRLARTCEGRTAVVPSHQHADQIGRAALTTPDHLRQD